jgi:ubiquinone/menaquinone biosynthesis C-methylase UbiE
MTSRVDLFDSTYRNFGAEVLRAIRAETFGHDIGQNSWVTVDEYDRFIEWLRLLPGDHSLEVASGSGGPALYLAQQTNCHVTGIDANASGVKMANESAAQARTRVVFQVADANATLPFADDTFDALLCIDSMNHLADRLNVLREWRRVLRPRGRAVFTDPVVITGPVTNDELALRSAVGLFLFVPPGVNETFIAQAGFKLIQSEDVSENCAEIAARWRDARERHREALIRLERDERFEGLQQFFDTVHRVTGERRLSRIVYLVEKPTS